MKRAIPALNEEGPQRRLHSGEADLIVLERRTESGDDRAFILVNRDREQGARTEKRPTHRRAC